MSEDFVKTSNFEVKLDGIDCEGVVRVDGLGFDFENVAEQADGDQNQLSNTAGRLNARDVVLTRKFKKDAAFTKWVNDTKADCKKAKTTGSITLLNQSGTPVLRYDLNGVWPASWSGPSLDSGTSATGVALETITLSVDDITFS